MNGRWEKNEYVWSCEGCGCVLCGPQVPAEEHARCFRCRAFDGLSLIRELVEQMSDERDREIGLRRVAERERDEALAQLKWLRQQLKARKERAA